jgi:hypothetical protein
VVAIVLWRACWTRRYHPFAYTHEPIVAWWTKSDIIDRLNAMQQNDDRQQSPAMRARVLEAEQRASADLSAILKSLAADDNIASREGSWRWAEFQIKLAALKFGGLTSTSAKRILRDGIIPRLIKYLNDFRFLANKSNAARGGGPQNVGLMQNYEKACTHFLIDPPLVFCVVHPGITRRLAP